MLTKKNLVVAVAGSVVITGAVLGYVINSSSDYSPINTEESATFSPPELSNASSTSENHPSSEKSISLNSNMVTSNIQGQSFIETDQNSSQTTDKQQVTAREVTVRFLRAAQADLKSDYPISAQRISRTLEQIEQGELVSDDWESLTEQIIESVVEQSLTDEEAKINTEQVDDSQDDSNQSENKNPPPELHCSQARPPSIPGVFRCPCPGDLDYRPNWRNFYNPKFIATQC